MQKFSLKKSSEDGKKEDPGSLKRPVFGTGAEGEEDDDGKRRVAVHGFDRETGAKVTNPEEPEEDPLVIKPKSNQNWLEVVKKRAYIPLQHQQQSGFEPPEEEKLQYGLNYVEKKGESDKLSSDLQSISEQKDASEDLSDEQKARRALLNGEERTENDLKIPLGRDNDDDERYYEEVPQFTEIEAYSQDYSSRPDAPDMDAYSRVPVEEFGAALLRGMGMKDSPKESNNNEQVIKRPAMLGLGAKHVPSEVNELGSWGKGTSSRASKKEDKAYVPLAKVSKTTGEKIGDEPSSTPSPRERRDDSNRRHRRPDREHNSSPSRRNHESSSRSHHSRSHYHRRRSRSPKLER